MTDLYFSGAVPFVDPLQPVSDRSDILFLCSGSIAASNDKETRKENDWRHALNQELL